MRFTVLKSDPSQHVVYGWGSISTDKASVVTDPKFVTKDGEVTDLQGDQIEPAELEHAVMEFMLDYRASGIMHEGEQQGIVIASFVTTPEIKKAFGLPDDFPVGWMIGVKVLSDVVWKAVLDGTLKAFSIQGSADRVELEAA
ncbi:MAG: XkdF-like putative serine protease domain-containing protein [Bryobacteraceae bacterium]